MSQKPFVLHTVKWFQILPALIIRNGFKYCYFKLSSSSSSSSSLTDSTDFSDFRPYHLSLLVGLLDDIRWTSVGEKFYSTREKQRGVLYSPSQQSGTISSYAEIINDFKIITTINDKLLVRFELETMGLVNQTLQVNICCIQFDRFYCNQKILLRLIFESKLSFRSIPNLSKF